MAITDELRSFIKDPLLGYASQEQHVEQLTTVEDALREFAGKWLHTTEGSEREDALVAEYAKRLRLAGDVE